MITTRFRIPLAVITAGGLGMAGVLALPVAALALAGRVGSEGATSSAPGAVVAPSASQLALARQVLPTGDGWASSGTGTTGGSTAAAQDVFTVTTRAQLVAALGADGTAPKIVFIKGMIDANTDAANHHLSCADYAAGTGYTLNAFLTAYSPATWGTTTVPAGPVEDARAAAAKVQGATVKINVGSNTTVIGLGNGSGIKGGNLMVLNADNVILRNLSLQDAADCFPKWDPTDSAVGNWNSAYDDVTVQGSSHVWLDHNSFTDKPNFDSTQPLYFGRPYQVHDGESDIVKGADLVTVSWNYYANHDKTILIGGSDNAANTLTDTGKLRVTLHHNEFDGIGQRAPRVRFGQVDVYDNYFKIPADSASYDLVYQVGIGKEAQIVAENNYFALSATGLGAAADAARLGKVISLPSAAVGTIHLANNLIKQGSAKAGITDLLAAYNAANPDQPLTDQVTWTPTLRTAVSPPSAVKALVAGRAGANHL